MKKILLLLSFILIISTKAYSGDGRGELQLSEHAVNEFTRYIKGDATKSGKTLRNKPLVFYITNDGSRTFWWYCPYTSCAASSTSADKKACLQATGKECSRFARGRYVRWDNGINPKGKKAKFNSKMTDSEIRAKLTKLGFYKNKKNTKVENNDSNIELSSKDKSIVDQLKELTDLFNNGSITEAEFIAAKNKLLN